MRVSLSQLWCCPPETLAVYLLHLIYIQRLGLGMLDFLLDSWSLYIIDAASARRAAFSEVGLGCNQDLQGGTYRPQSPGSLIQAVGEGSLSGHGGPPGPSALQILLIFIYYELIRHVQVLTKVLPST